MGAALCVGHTPVPNQTEFLMPMAILDCFGRYLIGWPNTPVQ